MSFRSIACLVLFALACAVVSCDGAGGPTIQPITPETVRVNEELTIELAFDNSDGRAVDLRIDDPMIVGLDRVSTISASPSGGTFRWVPLASQVGTHELTFVLTSDDGGTEYDRETAHVEVLPAEDAAPVFVRPGAGGTYDLTASPCVTFDVEVRDDDSATVEIGTRTEPPEGATLTNAGDKRATFDWCPTPDQIAASERYTIALFADDGEHSRVEHDYVVVLRSGPARDGCPGAAPTITISAPLMDERVTSSTGYAVEVTVADDLGLRDPPLLYYSRTEPEDPTRPDVTQFEQVVFEDAGGSWTARIPSLGLAEGEEATVYFLVSATDNDDDTGSLCDHRTDSDLVSFLAVGGVPGSGGGLAECARCGASSECSSGICAATAGGGLCVDACSELDCDSGVCGATATTEGSTRAGCGPVAEVCGLTTTCTDDPREENDLISTASTYSTPITDGQICPMDSDYIGISVPSGNRLTVTLDGFAHADGDLDLQLRSSRGTILTSSAGARDVETISYCNGGATETFYARVFGYASDQNQYSLTATRTPDATCCADDDFEPDDTRTGARSVTFTSDMASFEGSVCPSDDDWIAIPVSGPGRIAAEVAFDESIGDIDIELYSPTGTRIASSAGTSGTESIDVAVPGGGTYALRIFLYRGRNDLWLGEITRTVGSSCTTTLDCAPGSVCEAGSCASDLCTTNADCPSGHTCPTAGVAGSQRHCAMACDANSDCDPDFRCKWFVEGRGCGDYGGGANAAPCSTYADCGGQRTCVAWPGGYCARAGCDSNSDCESGTFCVTVGGVNVCALGCPDALNDPCRYSEEHWCDFVTTVSGASQWVCVPFG
jgi:hypothetical protein